MERLTDKKEADAQRQEYEKRLKNGYPRNIPEERFLKLASYEDTMPLERVQELSQAEKDGRLVMLPVKPGTKVYGIGYNFGSYGLVERYYNLAYYRPEEFLIATFKTREEAEAALKKREECKVESI